MRPLVKSCGSCQPTMWMAGMSPIRIGESVSWLTKSGMMVMKEAKPRAEPKKTPSMMLTMALNLTCS